MDLIPIGLPIRLGVNYLGLTGICTPTITVYQNRKLAALNHGAWLRGIGILRAHKVARAVMADGRVGLCNKIAGIGAGHIRINTVGLVAAQQHGRNESDKADRQKRSHCPSSSSDCHVELHPTALKFRGQVRNFLGLKFNQRYQLVDQVGRIVAKDNARTYPFGRPQYALNLVRHAA